MPVTSVIRRSISTGFTLYVPGSTDVGCCSSQVWDFGNQPELRRLKRPASLVDLDIHALAHLRRDHDPSIIQYWFKVSGRKPSAVHSCSVDPSEKGSQISTELS